MCSGGARAPSEPLILHPWFQGLGFSMIYLGCTFEDFLGRSLRVSVKSCSPKPKFLVHREGRIWQTNIKMQSFISENSTHFPLKPLTNLLLRSITQQATPPSTHIHTRMVLPTPLRPRGGLCTSRLTVQSSADTTPSVGDRDGTAGYAARPTGADRLPPRRRPWARGRRCCREATPAPSQEQGLRDRPSAMGEWWERSNATSVC